MDEKELDRDSGSVAFGQLLGMCDHVSLTLGKLSTRIARSPFTDFAYVAVVLRWFDN